MIEPNTFICGDCKDVLEQLPDGFADLCLTDPPYGIGWDRENIAMSAGIRKDGSQRYSKSWSNPKPKNYESKNWDNEKPDSFDDVFRVSKKRIIWGGNYFNFPVSGGWIVWNKKVVMPSLSKCELAWTDISQHIELFEYMWAGYLKEQPEERFHPTQKPVALFVWCLQKYSKPGDLIIDPFCGSGTTALACHKTGRRFVCIDKDPDYIKIAKRRYEELIAQGDLFGSAPEQRQPQNSVQHSYEAINLK